MVEKKVDDVLVLIDQLLDEEYCRVVSFRSVLSYVDCVNKRKKISLEDWNRLAEAYSLGAHTAENTLKKINDENILEKNTYIWK